MDWFLLFVVGSYIFSRFITQGVEKIGKDTEEVWIGSLPTIGPGDDNPNPIMTRIGKYGRVEYYRKAVRR